MVGKLFIVPTPIGNLGDITLRSLEVLKNVDFILAEDTRSAYVLLNHYEIKNKIYAHHQNNEHKALTGIIKMLNEGSMAAIISEAGTPAISDPGFLLVRECIKNNIPVETLPGATAFVPALINSALPCNRFCFEGFLPLKKGRSTRLSELAKEERTIIIYEAPHRIIKLLDELILHFSSERKASLSREITKIYEETLRGTLSEIKNTFENRTIKGEIVICIAGMAKE